MRLEYQIAAAFGLDLLLGDPPWLPHPVKLVGRFAALLEAPLRKAIPCAYLAGAAAWTLVVGVTGCSAWGLVAGAGYLHPVAQDVVAVLLLYTAFAARDLANHSSRVLRALRAGDLAEARRRVGLIVGRDTANLDEVGVVRATVESVAESTVDGVTAPLFFAALGGPVAALAYKAVNTLDSMFGHKDERYRQFGWASARLDDVANFLPARMTAPLVALTAAILWIFDFRFSIFDCDGDYCGGRILNSQIDDPQICQLETSLVHVRGSENRKSKIENRKLLYRPVAALRILARDGRKHPSPNAGLSEAAVAGALNVQLGGLNLYAGEPHEGALIGDPNEPLNPQHIARANALMLGTALLALLLFVGLRVLVLALLHGGAL